MRLAHKEKTGRKPRLHTWWTLLGLGLLTATVAVLAVTVPPHMNASPTAAAQKPRVQLAVGSQQPVLTTVSSAEEARGGVILTPASSAPTLAPSSAAHIAQADFGGNMPVREVVYAHVMVPRRNNFSQDAWIVILTPNDAPVGPVQTGGPVAGPHHSASYLMVWLDGQSGGFLGATEGS